MTLDFSYVILSVLVMTIVTYVVRLLPFIIFKKQITNKFFKSFLYYVPYAVLSAMAFPAIFTATGDLTSSLVATGVALVLAFFRQSLVVVASGAAISALIVSLVF